MLTYSSDNVYANDAVSLAREWAFSACNALVPQETYAQSNIVTKNPTKDLITGDRFYSKLLAIAERLRAKIILVEVTDMDQAKRVVGLAAESDYWEIREIWRDYPD